MLPADKQISVTGYSLEGHLAAAFNIMHGAETTTSGQPLIKEVVTFNGAGVGTVNPDTSLAQVMTKFDTLRRDIDYATLITDTTLHDVYERTRANIIGGGTISDGDRAVAGEQHRIFELCAVNSLTASNGRRLFP
jgi:hypothetical protein